MSYPPPPPNDPYSNQPSQPYGQPAYGQPAYGQPATAAYAGWGARVGAYLVDYLVAVPFGILAVVLGMGTDAATGLPTINAFYYIFFLLAIVVSGYNRWFLAGKTGQSWGRKALGIRLVGENTGQPIGAGGAFVRDLAHILDSLACGIGYLFPLWDAKKQTFADKVCKTLVVR
ncbi:RDD family protein [Actinoplanes sp. NEAU-A12]|uniref:RDD family protein n=1 Tax=Actinoplanes sandaracinus TaxID=3045177 RepID=A0ABT6WV03_9ACTN|nr:RDD family protein [Actinoplanes sandaracinus]MDI6103445.1 RDD family protein [Actinoplanes sandaracinus]